MRIYNFTTGQWEDEEKVIPKYQGFKSTMQIGGGGNSAPAAQKSAMSPKPEQPYTGSKVTGLSAWKSLPRQETAKPVNFGAGSSYLTGQQAPAVSAPKLSTSSYGAAGSFTLEQIAAAKRRKQAEVDYNRTVKFMQGYGADDFLKKSGAFTDAEKEAANRLLAAMNKRYAPQFRQYQGNRDGMGARPLPEDLRITQAKMEALKLKTKGSEAALYGVLDSATFGLSERLEKGENEKRISRYEAKLASGQPLTKMEQADYLMLQALGGGTSFGAAREQNPLAYGAAKFGAEGVKYALGSKAVEAIPGAGKAMGKAGELLSKATHGTVSPEVMTRLLEGRVTDLPFDIISAAVETDNVADFAKSLGINQAAGLAMDSGMEGIAAGWKAIKNAASEGRLVLPERNVNISGQEIGAYTMPQEPVDLFKKTVEDAKAAREAALDAPMKVVRQTQYMDQINRVMRGENPPDIIKIGNTPEILKRFGAKDRVLTMNPAAVRKIAYPNGYMGGQHNLGFYALEHLPEQLENPVAILKSATQDNSLVVFTEFLDQENRPVMAALHLDKLGRVGVTNNVASYYGRKGFDSFLAEQRSAGNVLFEDKKRTLEQLPGIGLQLPKMEADADPMFNIAQQPQKINGQNGGNYEGRIDAPLIEATQKAKASQEAALKAPMEDALAIKAKTENVPGLPVNPDGTDAFGRSVFGQNTVGAAESAFPPKRKVSASYDNTFQKTRMYTQAEKELANAKGMDKKFEYDQISEKQSMAEAAQRMQADAAGEMMDLPVKGSWSGTDLDTAMLILEQKRDIWRKTGNSEDMLKWAKMVQEKGTEAGQMIQAFAKYSRTPEGTIVKAEKVIADYGDKLRAKNPKLFNAIDEFAEQLARNSSDFMHDLPADPDAAVAKLKNAIEDMAKKNGKVQLDDELTDEIIRAIQEGRGGKDAIGDILEAANLIPKLTSQDVDKILDIMAQAEDLPLYSKQRFQLENQAWKVVADHFDSSFMDKWNAWRYLSMLGNPRTHIRNMTGNTVFGAVTRIKNGVAAVIESAVDGTSRMFGGEGIQRTKTLAAIGDGELRKAAKEDFENMYTLVTGNGKYNPSDMLRDNKTVFKTKWLEGARKANNKALEFEDALSLKDRYSANLAGYLKANGADKNIFENTSQEAQNLLNQARDYAIEQAQKATFRDDSAMANALNKLSKSSKAANLIVEGIVPFKKTPINIVKRGIEYSPAGLGKGLYDAVDAVRTGRKTAAQAIDEIAAGLTGTGILYVGYKLAENNLISGSAGEDARERGFDTLTGNQNYALTIGSKSYTLDWMAPAALPLFVGAELQKTLGAKGITGADLLDSITKITEPVLDMTMMQGLNDAIQSAAYDQTGPLASIGINAASNYATQGLPTAFGQVARAVDDTRRSTYYGGGAFLDRYLPEKAKNAASGNPLLEKAIQAQLPKPLDITLQKAMAKTPWLSMWLNPKVDQWGREQKNRGGSFVGRLAYNTLSPGFYSEQNMTDVDKEIERLYGESQGDKSVLPGYAAKTIAQKDAQGNKETKRLTATEFVQFAKDKGGAAYKSLDTLFQSQAYKAADDSNKAKMVADIYEYTNAAAKAGVSNYKATGWVEKAMEAGKNGIPLEDYVVCRNVLTPLKHNVEKNGALLSMQADSDTKEKLYGYFVSDSEGSRKKIDAFKGVGLDMDDFLTASVEYAKIDDGGGTAQEKATKFYHWLDTQGLNKQEYDTVASIMPYFQMFPAKPQAYRVDMMSASGQKKWAKAKAWGLSEKQYTKYYKIATQQKKKAEIMADLQKAGMTAQQAAYFWGIIKSK